MTAATFLNDPSRQSALGRVAEEVAAVEAILRDQLCSDVELVQTISRHTLDAGGKRLRPALVGLSAAATGRPFESSRARKLGACVEMIHMATLIHDDVIDRAATRRGRPTASSIYGSTASILSGDVILARSMAILAADGDLEIIRAVSQAVVELAEGEVRELTNRDIVDLSETEHLATLEMKTASLLSCCCEVGARVAGASDIEREALRRFGRHVGLAFQIADDLLDYRGREDATGKPLATDYREGCATLPLIILWPKLDDSERDRVKANFGGEPTPDEIENLRTLMSARGAFAQTEALAQSHVDAALQALETLPASEERELLASVAAFVVKRDR